MFTLVIKVPDILASKLDDNILIVKVANCDVRIYVFEIVTVSISSNQVGNVPLIVAHTHHKNSGWPGLLVLIFKTFIFDIRQKLKSHMFESL